MSKRIPWRKITDAEYRALNPEQRDAYNTWFLENIAKQSPTRPFLNSSRRKTIFKHEDAFRGGDIAMGTAV